MVDEAARRLGCIFAHPDDETFCVGGTIAKYAAAGAEISLFCATNGDAGKTASVPVSSREQLAELRREELTLAARTLGIGAVTLGGYGDGTLGALDPTSLIGDVVAFLRRHRPTVVVTFGPEGAPTGHPDHRAMSRAATAAFFLSGLSTAYPEQLADGLEPFRAARLFYHAWASPLPDPRLRLEPVPPTATIDIRPFRPIKEAAFACHRTQQLSREAFERSLADAERLAFAAGIPQPAAMVDDLFTGL